MTIYVDSAVPAEVREAVSLGFVTAVTTNPTLVAATGRPARELLPELTALVPGTVFYQLTAPTLADRVAEAEAMLALAPGRIGLKVPATTENMALVARFRAAPVAVTTLFAAPQAVAAIAAGARYLIPYVNRTTRLCGDGIAWVRTLRALANAMGGHCELLAASLKSPAEAVDTLLAGAQHLSLPLAVLRDFADHPLSRDAIDDFQRRP